MISGVDLIAAERRRQREVEGWTADHDDEHTGGELAQAAVCYAATEQLYRKRGGFNNGVVFEDPWPFAWDRAWDKRARSAYGPSYSPGPLTPRIRNLVKAGALIAAEIDRLQRSQRKD